MILSHSRNYKGPIPICLFYLLKAVGTLQMILCDALIVGMHRKKNQLVLICCFFTRAKEIMCLKISLWELYPTITKFRHSVTTIQCVQLILIFSFEMLLLFLFSNSTAWKARCINLILLTKY